MTFQAFDNTKPEAYAAQAKAAWGHTDAYREYEQKSKGRSGAEQKALGAELMALFGEFGAVRAQSPASQAAQALVKKLQAFITAH